MRMWRFISPGVGKRNEIEKPMGQEGLWWYTEGKSASEENKGTLEMKPVSRLRQNFEKAPYQSRVKRKEDHDRWISHDRATEGIIVGG